MTLSVEDLAVLSDCANEAAIKAGAFIARSRPESVEHKSSVLSPASQVVTEVDRRSQDLILEVLRPTVERFDLGVLAEEQDDDGGRFEKEFFWCVDPLDGTLPFIESTPGYAVSIALVSRGGIPQLGAVYDPVERTLYHCVRGGGAYRNERRWTVAETSQPRGTALSVFMDRSFPQSRGHAEILAGLEMISAELGLLVPRVHTSGAAVMNACRALAHAPGCYFKLPKPTDGGGSVWDFAATACLFHEAGAVATDIHGGRLDLNRPDSTFMNHRGALFATSEDLAQRIGALCSRIIASDAGDVLFPAQS